MSQAVNYVKIGLTLVYDRRTKLHNLNFSCRQGKKTNDDGRKYVDEKCIRGR